MIEYRLTDADRERALAVGRGRNGANRKIGYSERYTAGKTPALSRRWDIIGAGGEIAASRALNRPLIAEVETHPVRGVGDLVGDVEVRTRKHGYDLRINEWDHPLNESQIMLLVWDHTRCGVDCWLDSRTFTLVGWASFREAVECAEMFTALADAPSFRRFPWQQLHDPGLLALPDGSE